MQLMAAKRQWKGQLGIVAENNENNALSMAKNFLHQNRFVPLDEVFTRIDEVSVEKLNEVANRVFSSAHFQLSYV